MNPLKTFFLTIVLCSAIIGKSQSTEKTKIREVSLNTSTFESFGMKYKKGLNDKVFFTIALANVNFSFNENKYQTTEDWNNSTISTNANLIIGIEKQKQRSDKFVTYCGANIIAGGYLLRLKDDNPSISEEDRKKINFYYQGGVSLNLGAQYMLADDFYIGGSLSPSITLRQYKQEVNIYNGDNSWEKHYNTSNRVLFNADSGFLSIYLAYRW